MRNARIYLLAVLALVATLGLVAGAPGLALSDPATQGTLEVVCNIGNTTPTDSVACRVSLDGAVQPQDILPGQAAAYALDVGSHLLQVDLVGDHAAFWGSASQQQTVAILTGQTTRSVQTFAKKGHLRANLSQPGIPGDFFVDGQLVAGQVTSIDLWVTPRVSHKIEVKNITDPATTDAYRWLDASASASLRSGQEKTVTLSTKKAYVKGFLNLDCQVRYIQESDDVSCNVAIDGQNVGIAPAGEPSQYSVLPGQHTVTISLTGLDAAKWEAARSQNVRIRLGKTTNATITLELLPYQYTATLSGINDNTRAIYRRGQQLRNKSNVFVKVGDCDSANNFLYLIDSDFYDLGDYNALQEAVNFFIGAFNHRGLAAHDGYVAASVLDPIWADPAFCNPGETSLACEYRIQKPSVALIMLRTYHYGENWQERYYQDMKTIVEYSLKQGVIPVLSTLPYINGHIEMNERIKLLATQYNVPLWDFFVTTNQLPNQGIDVNAHLTLPPTGLTTFFMDEHLNYGMPRRNLEGLEVLLRIKKEVMKK
jgi:hypothetical protein